MYCDCTILHFTVVSEESKLHKFCPPVTAVNSLSHQGIFEAEFEADFDPGDLNCIFDVNSFSNSPASRLTVCSAHRVTDYLSIKDLRLKIFPKSL